MDPRHVDLKYLNEISGGNKDLILEMIQIFNSEVPGYIKLMNEFYGKQKWEALGKLSHKARASASIMGMKQLVDELKNLELLAQDKKDTQLYISFLRSIEKQFLAAIEELELYAETL